MRNIKEVYRQSENPGSIQLYVDQLDTKHVLRLEQSKKEFVVLKQKVSLRLHVPSLPTIYSMNYRSEH